MKIEFTEGEVQCFFVVAFCVVAVLCLYSCAKTDPTMPFKQPQKVEKQ